VKLELGITGYSHARHRRVRLAEGWCRKSTLARALATSAAAPGTNVRVADLDIQQETTKRWAERREEYDAGPEIAVIAYETAGEAIDSATLATELIIDAPPRTSSGTLQIARHADLVVQPTGPGIDDLDPAILLFHELSRAGIPRDKLAMALCRVASKSEEDLARRYVEKAGYMVLPGAILERTAYREAHNRGLSIAELKDLDDHSRALMQALFGLITMRVRARVETAQATRKRAGKKG
jgi:chromosome partitioning protein